MAVEMTGILMISLSFLYWLSAQAVKEIAYNKVRENCQLLKLQMLDDYVALQRLRFIRDSNGRICIARTYGFEFSATGAERYQGQIVLIGRQMQTIRMDAYRILDYSYDKDTNV